MGARMSNRFFRGSCLQEYFYFTFKKATKRLFLIVL